MSWIQIWFMIEHLIHVADPT